MILLDQITSIDFLFFFLFFFSAKMRMKLLKIVVVLLVLGSSDARPQRTGKNLSRRFARLAKIKIGTFYRGNVAGARKKWKGKGGSFPDGNKTIRIVTRTNRVFIRL